MAMPMIARHSHLSFRIWPARRGSSPVSAGAWSYRSAMRGDTGARRVHVVDPTGDVTNISDPLPPAATLPGPRVTAVLAALPVLVRHNPDAQDLAAPWATLVDERIAEAP